MGFDTLKTGELAYYEFFRCQDDRQLERNPIAHLTMAGRKS